MGKKLVCGSKEYTVKDVTVREDKLRDLYKLYIKINATDVTLSEIEALITNKADKEYYEDSTLVATYTGYYNFANLVAGMGGFAIFWFAVKKKTFVDLGASIKAIFTKKK